MGSIKELNDRAAALYNAADIKGLAALYAEDAVLTNPDTEVKGREAILEFWTQEKAAFPDSRVENTLTVESGDVLMAEFAWSGTNTGAITLPDGSQLPATGKRAEVKGAECLLVRDGLVAEHRMYWDNLAAFTQLGLIPEQ